MDLPLQIYTGVWNTSHIQGIAVDSKRGHIYYSFTTLLVKSTLKGEIIGTVSGIYGHLGCIAYNSEENRIYASLEFKNDAIGKGVQKNINAEEYSEESFHAAIFSCDKIDRLNMDAFGDKVMTTVYLKTVAEDYLAEADSINGKIKHRYGCSGIDGISFGPDFGANSGKQYLCVAYGIYKDLTRGDNDYQVILQYDTSDWAQYESTAGLSKNGVENPRNKFFVYTGNTEWGIQNLEYDSFTNRWFAAVYKGAKPQFPNYTLFSIDGNVKSEMKPLLGINGETGLVLALSEDGLYDEKTGIHGYESQYGSTGLASLGGGRFYISHHGTDKGGSYSNIYLYKWTGNAPCPWEYVSP